MAQRKLTDRQQEALDFIATFIEQHGYAPSGQDLAGGLGITLRPAQKLINALYVKDYITKIPRCIRGIVIR
jgi:repressor LexA